MATGNLNKNKIFIGDGYTLIELLVSMGLFIIIVSIAAASFVRGIQSQKSAVNLMEVNDNASLTIEQMAREIRTGYYFCTNDYPINFPPYPNYPDCALLDDDELQFVNSYNEVVWYRLRNEAIERGAENASTLARTYVKITADNVNVERLNFELFGNDLGDGFPPRITVRFTIAATGRYLEDFKTHVQTTVSARLIDT